jgi:hypothetical protein
MHVDLNEAAFEHVAVLKSAGLKAERLIKGCDGFGLRRRDNQVIKISESKLRHAELLSLGVYFSIFMLKSAYFKTFYRKTRFVR